MATSRIVDGTIRGIEDWKDVPTGMFELVHEDTIYHDYEPKDSDSIAGYSRVTLCDNEQDYCVLAPYRFEDGTFGGEETIGLTRTEALAMIAGEFVPA